MSGIEDLVTRGVVARDVPLGPHTTYKSGGPARYFVVCDDLAALVDLSATGELAGMPVLVLGRGSNLVVADGGFPGLVIRLGSGFAKIEIEGAKTTAGSAVSLPQLARATVNAGRSGLEFFVGVPGSVGGAVRQNAGCFGVETRERLIEATVVDLGDGTISTRGPESLDLSYRHSNLRPTEVVIEAVFATGEGDIETGLLELRRITRWRRDHQPGGTFNAGSVFKNPEGTTAGELIDSLGLKGLKVGDVSVSKKHANFFVAGPVATSADILELVGLVKDRVFQETGTILEPEIQFVGFEE
ncbi:MAG: UDP-N-acetylmuramate dehydrogenase [Acidimicrobiia bacterium]